MLSRLDLPGWDLHFEDGLRGGVACTRAVVRGEDGATRTFADVEAIVRAAVLPQRVEARALAVFGALATAEAALHRMAVAEVHLHEVGGHDALVDVVGTAAALEVLGVDEVCASPVATGTGMLRSAHGLLPNPAPATVRLLQGVPTYGRDVPVELTTPTGAALVASWCSAFGPLPAMEVRASGFGGGTAELDDLPNCTQVVLGRRAAAPSVGGGQVAVVLETNLDDVTGEQLGHAMAARARSRSARRLGEPGGHEEGTAGARAPRDERRGARREVAARDGARDRHDGDQGRGGGTLAAGPTGGPRCDRRQDRAHEGDGMAGQARVRRRGRACGGDGADDGTRWRAAPRRRGGTRAGEPPG